MEKINQEKNNQEETRQKSKFKTKLGDIWNNRFFGITWVRLGILAILLNIVVESLSRHSVVGGFSHIGINIYAFLYNCLLIFFTLTFTYFFKKRIFAVSLISTFWVGIGLVNCVMLFNRKTPFTAPDLRNITDFFNILQKTFNNFEIALIILLIVSIIGGIVFTAIKSPKISKKINYLLGGLITAISFGAVMLMINLGLMTGLLADNFGNIANAYKQYGFGYCFFASVFDSGIDKPKDYSKDTVDELVGEIESTEPNKPTEPDGPNEPEKTEYPNIVFVQLESLFDPTHLKGLEFSEEPLPNLKALYKEYSSGYLSMPSFGAGTANTEFEVIAGMNLDDFGPGEYPYKTILKKSACESICYYLKNYGYVTNALHNNEGDFYQRNSVFGNLGFDTFTSIEYIEEYDTTPMGWAKDDCLIGEITGMIKANKAPNFIYTISVQGHGDFPAPTEDMTLKVTNNDVTGNPEGFEYFVNQIHEMDVFVKNLVDEVSKIDEKTVIVFYGDHLPTFDIENEDLTNGDIYQTQYVIWSNFGLEKEDKDIQAFQLSSLVMNRLGLKGGIISKLHMAYMDSEDEEAYLEKLTLLEYDILYGDCEAYGGIKPYYATNLKMGYKDITIDEIISDENGITVKGSNYTGFSKVLINGKVHETEFISNSELRVEGYTFSEEDKIAVVIEDRNGDILSSTSIFEKNRIKIN